MIPATGTYNIQVQTPAGTTGNLGCSTGGKSATLTLTVT
jgi:D-serine dehydratase